MNSPAAALTWEIWRKHRNRLLAIAISILCFALFYPRLCAVIGLQLEGPNSLDLFASTFSTHIKQTSPLLGAAEVLLMILLLLSPLGCMVTSLLYIVWIFTFAEGDLQKGFSFPARLFRLPLSTRFLSGGLMLAGAASITLVFLGWTQLVHQPPIDVFLGYPNLLVWLTLLTLTQASVWALDGFPISRLVFLSASVFFLGFLAGPSIAEHAFLAQNRTLILLSLFTAGGIIAPLGLKKIRHGNWQRFRWPAFLTFLFATRPITLNASAAPAKNPFPSPALAQLWFEWRRQGRKMFFAIAALSGTGLLIMTIMSLVNGGLSDGDIGSLLMYLLAVPILVHFAFGVGPERNLPQFIAIRPITAGEMVFAKLKAAALSASFSWLLTAAMLAIVPLLGDVRSVIEPPDFIQPTLLLRFSPVLLLAAIALTWRFVAVNLCFGAGADSWVSRVPVVLPYVAMLGLGIISLLAREPRRSQFLLNILPIALGALLVVKLALAAWSFRACLKKNLLECGTMLKFLLLWGVLAIAFVLSGLALFHNQPWVLSAVLGILLLLPLARIALAPVATSMLRHR
jgi:hypothetical protein